MVRMYSEMYQDDANGNMLPITTLFVNSEDYVEFRNEFNMAKFCRFTEYGNELWITNDGIKIIIH